MHKLGPFTVLMAEGWLCPVLLPSPVFAGSKVVEGRVQSHARRHS